VNIVVVNTWVHSPANLSLRNPGFDSGLQAMEVTLQGSENIRSDAILSIKLGDTRRQSSVQKIGQAFKFSSSPAEPLPLQVTLMAPIAPVQTLRMNPSEEQFVVDFGKDMKLHLTHREVEELRNAPAFTATDVAKTGKDVDAEKAKNAEIAAKYMESHDLVRTFQEIIHGLLVQKPDDPYAYLEEHIARSKALAYKKAGGSKSSVSDNKRGIRQRSGSRSKIEMLMDMLKRGKNNLNMVMPFLPNDFQMMLFDEEFVQECEQNFKDLDVAHTGALAPKDLIPLIIQLSEGKQHSVTTEQAEQFTAMFDDNNDGVINQGEFCSLLQFCMVAFFLESSEGQDLVLEVKQEETRFDEFLLMLEENRDRLEDVIPYLPQWLTDELSNNDFFDMCEARFKELDDDGSGVLEPDELLPVIIQLCESHPLIIDLDKCKRFVKVFDTHGDGVIRADEFVDFTQFMMVMNFLASNGSVLSSDPSPAAISSSAMIRRPSADDRGKVGMLLDTLKRGKMNLTLVLPFLPQELQDMLTGPEFEQECLEDFMRLDSEKKGCLSSTDLIPVMVHLSEAKEQSVTSEQVQEFLQLFDQDGNGEIDVQEFFAATQFILVCQYLSTGEGQELRADVELEESKFNEYLSVLEHDRSRLRDMVPYLPEWMLDLVTSDGFLDDCDAKFRELDVDGSGALEPDELLPVIVQLCDAHPLTIDLEKCQRFMDVFDKDGNGVIERDEFAEFTQFVMVTNYFATAGKDMPIPTEQRAEEGRRKKKSGYIEHGDRDRSKVDVLLEMLQRSKANVEMALPMLPDEFRDMITNAALEKESVQSFVQLDVNKNGFLEPHELAPLILELLEGTALETSSIDVQQCKQFMDFFDSDQNGVISADEFFPLVQYVMIFFFLQSPAGQDALTLANQEQPDLSDWLNMLEKDKDGLADVIPFLPESLIEQITADEFFTECRKAFKDLDLDASGVLEPDELLPVVQGLIDKDGTDLGMKVDLDQCTRFTKIFDANGDGVMQVNEFIELCQFLMVMTHLSGRQADSPVAQEPATVADVSGLSADVEFYKTQTEQLQQENDVMRSRMQTLEETVKLIQKSIA